MEHLTLYYSIRNGGDGSANAVFMESADLARWDQDHLMEGWGECCMGKITLQSESPISHDKDVYTKESMYLDLFFNDDEYFTEFVEEFFPAGVPTFTVKPGTDRYYNIYIEDKFIATKFAYPEVIPTEEKALTIQQDLNG